MDYTIIIVGLVLVIVGIVRHYTGASTRRIGFQLVRLPGIIIAGLGVVFVVAGILL
jgi:hypothetical protein